MFKLTPIVAQHDWRFYRVPLVRVDRNGVEYEVYLNDNLCRIYNDNTLPDFIKSKLAMILASGKKLNIPKGSFVTELDLYINCAGKEFDEIGWASIDGMFIIILSEQELASLQGESLN